MAEASTSRLGLCQTCNTTPARYKCPGCAFPSCSVACSSAHKTAANCSGVAPPVWSRPIQANEMSWGSLMRDQSYIAGVGRAVEEVGRQLVQEKTLPQGRGAAGKGRIDEEQVRLDERSDKEEKMVREARNDGVELVLLPKGMSKRLKNGTRWDQKNNRMEWTVEVAFQPRPSTDPSSSSSSTILATTVPQPASASLHTVLSAALAAKDKKGKGKEVSPEDAAWVLAEKAWVESLKPVKEAAQAGKRNEAREDVAEEAAVDAEPPAIAGDGDAELEQEAAAEPALPAMDAPSAEILPIADAQAPPSTDTAPPVGPAPPDSPPEEPPFVLLLAFFARPSASPFSEDSSSAAADPSSSRPSRPPARPLYLIPLPLSSPLPDLRTALSGSTILEYPTFEIWPRESFLRQKLLGKIRVVEKPTGDEVRREAEARAAYSGGRGRGRGRGRGGGGGRGGYGGAREERDDSGSGGGVFEGRAQDSGWGKRGAPQLSSDEPNGEKRLRLDES
ncbi:hypothetical protein JCM11251_007128 [Rhodosporidiobolus azoricus]